MHHLRCIILPSARVVALSAVSVDNMSEAEERREVCVPGVTAADTFQHACEVRAERRFIACSQSRIIDAQPPRGNMGHQDELQARGGRPTRFLTACLAVCEGVEITGVWGLLVGGV